MGKSESSSSLFPWLLYCQGENNKNRTLCNIVSSTHQSCSIPHLKNNTILASSHGWLILIKSHKQSHADFYSLWNPMTSESIDFPPFNINPNHNINSSVLSSPPNDPISMFLLFESTLPAIFVCRLSNNNPSEWIELRYDIGSDAHDLFLYSPVSCNGQVFARRKFKELFRVEIRDDNTVFLHQLPSIPPVPAPHSYNSLENLVECCGELYKVECTLGGVRLRRQIISVYVFKLNFSEMIWELKVDNIEDHAFFLSKNGAISCPAPSLLFAQRNRIYITLDAEENHKISLYSYHLEDGTLTLMSRPCPDLAPPWISIWVAMPTQQQKALVDQERKDDNNIEVFPWTNLPMDLQTLIAQKLPIFDYMNFRALCRMNRLLAPPIQLRSKLAGLDRLSPCLIFSPSGKNGCNFLHPTLSGRYFMNIRQRYPEWFQDDTGAALSVLFEDPIVRCCKESWLLMSASEPSEPFSDVYPMFLFNPFTKETILLPDMEIQPDPAVCFCLSALPDSEDCRVFCFVKQRDEKVKFLTTYPHAQEWTPLTFDNGTNFNPIDNVPFVYDGKFFCMDEKAQLAYPTTAKQGWSWAVGDVRGRPKDFHQSYLVEWNQLILSVFVGHSGNWVKVFVVEQREVDGATFVYYEPLPDLGNHVLYLSRLSTLSIEVAEGEGTSKNRIYFDRLYRGSVVYYSLTTQKFHTADGKHSLTSYHDTSEPLLCAWIAPPWK